MYSFTPMKPEDANLNTISALKEKSNVMWVIVDMKMAVISLAASFFGLSSLETYNTR